MYGRSFISPLDFSAVELAQLVEIAYRMKNEPGDTGSLLAGKTLGLLFNATSTRTRLSFQVAARSLGAHAEHLSASDLALANQESMKDTAAVMGRYLDGIIARLYEMSRSGGDAEPYGSGREAMRTLVEHSGVPVINALDDQDHPCQVMSDVLTIRERFGLDFRRRKVVLTWAYSEKQKSIGVTHSMLGAAAELGMNLTLAFPVGFEPDPGYLAKANARARAAGAQIEICHDLQRACAGADVVYTKSYRSLTLSAEEDTRAREELRSGWCLREDHFRGAAPGAIYMNCLPMIRGQEATAEVADGPRSIIYDEAENRLHLQRALLAALLCEGFWERSTHV